MPPPVSDRLGVSVTGATTMVPVAEVAEGMPPLSVAL